MHWTQNVTIISSGEKKFSRSFALLNSHCHSCCRIHHQRWFHFPPSLTKKTESKLHLQSPLLPRLGLDRAEMIDRNLRCWMKTYLFVIWSEDDSEKSIIRSQVFGSPGLLVLIRFEDLGRYVPLSFENTMLNLVSLRGVKGTKHVFLKDHASSKSRDN